MKTKEIKLLLKQSINENTPNLLDSISKTPIIKKEVFDMDTKLEKKVHKKVIIIPTLTLLIICCFIFFIVYFLQNQQETLLSLDVNPSIELILNKQEKVIKCVGKNEDSQKIIKNMDLKNVDADVALNAVVGSLYQNGYLDKNIKDNDILLSVDNKDKTKTMDLEKKYANILKNTLKSNHTSGTILTQKDISNSNIKKLAEKYQISEGKASFIEKLIEKSPDLNFEKLATMNIKELVNYMKTNNLKIENLETEDIDDDDDADDILDQIHEHEENTQDKLKEEEEKKQEILIHEQEKEQERIEKEQDQLKENTEKEQEKRKKEQEKAQQEQDRLNEQQDKLNEQKQEEQDRLNEQRQQEQDKLQEQQEQDE